MGFDWRREPSRVAGSAVVGAALVGVAAIVGRYVSPANAGETAAVHTPGSISQAGHGSCASTGQSGGTLNCTVTVQAEHHEPPSVAHSSALRKPSAKNTIIDGLRIYGPYNRPLIDSGGGDVSDVAIVGSTTPDGGAIKTGGGKVHNVLMGSDNLGPLRAFAGTSLPVGYAALPPCPTGAATPPQTPQTSTVRINGGCVHEVTTDHGADAIEFNGANVGRLSVGGRPDNQKESPNNKCSNISNNINLSGVPMLRLPSGYRCFNIRGNDGPIVEQNDSNAGRIDVRSNLPAPR
jgi:hypothetical protein